MQPLEFNPAYARQKEDSKLLYGFLFRVPGQGCAVTHIILIYTLPYIYVHTVQVDYTRYKILSVHTRYPYISSIGVQCSAAYHVGAIITKT